MLAAEKTEIMQRWAARTDNARIKQMHPQWLKHRQGPSDPPEDPFNLSRMQSLLEAASPDQLAQQVRLCH